MCPAYVGKAGEGGALFPLVTSQLPSAAAEVEHLMQESVFGRVTCVQKVASALPVGDHGLG